ncbi:MAG: class I SAM-dependent methyltransferase [Synechococcaceae cyanobacterium]
MSTPISITPFPEDAFNYLAKAEGRHWWFRSRNQIIIWALSEKAQSLNNFLEVGCGTGYVISGIARAFPLLRLEASEYFEDGLFFARQRLPECTFRQLDATAMSEHDGYGSVGSFDVLEHIQADQLVLANFNRALRRGGLLLLTVPQHPWLWSAADEYAHHVRRYKQSDLLQKVRMAGFDVEYCTSFVSLLLPVMALQRIASRKAPYNPDSEFKISPFLNSLLFLVMQIELLLLKLGLRFPAGGSFLLLARKR